MLTHACIYIYIHIHSITHTSMYALEHKTIYVYVLYAVYKLGITCLVEWIFTNKKKETRNLPSNWLI